MRELINPRPFKCSLSANLSSWTLCGCCVEENVTSKEAWPPRCLGPAVTREVRLGEAPDHCPTFGEIDIEDFSESQQA